MTQNSPQIKSADDSQKQDREYLKPLAPEFFEIPVTTSEKSEVKHINSISDRNEKKSSRISIAWTGVSLLGMAFALMGSWFVWFRIDRGFWPFRYTEDKITSSFGATHTPPVHLPEGLVAVTFCLVLLGFILVGIGTWKKMPKFKK